jgi:hypothetical protein
MYTAALIRGTEGDRCSSLQHLQFHGMNSPAVRNARLSQIICGRAVAPLSGGVGELLPDT